MQVLLEEAKDSYREEIVWELQSDTHEQMLDNVQRIEQFIQQYK